jgi:hypothetical protein
MDAKDPVKAFSAFNQFTIFPRFEYWSSSQRQLLLLKTSSPYSTVGI